MKGEIVLWKNNKRLNSARNEVICLTFLTTQHHLWTLIPLMLRTYCRIKKSFPYAEFYSLKHYINSKWKPGRIVKEMPGFELTMSLLNPRKLKLLCMPLESNSKGERISDIDVYIFYRAEKQLCKFSRKNI